MFIKKVKKKNKGFEKEFTYLHLVESVRTEKGPRQKLILNLGAIDIDEAEYKNLADCIEDLLLGNASIFPFDEEIVEIAEKAKEKILSKKSEEEELNEEEIYTPCNLNTIEASKARSIGAEHVSLEMWNLLELDSVLKDENLSQSQIDLCKAQVIGRLCNPGSDLSTWEWLEERSGLYELMTPPEKRSLNSFYRAADCLLESKIEIEKHLNKQESSLFNLQKKFCLFDLTNTFLEGLALKNDLSSSGRSKEKMSDCKLLTLGLMIDEDGFPEKTMFFSGNQSEPATLEKMIEGLREENPKIEENKPHIILDAGIATTKNLEYLSDEGFKYIVVSKAKKDCTILQDDLEELKLTKAGSKIKVKKEVVGDEALLLCHSNKKALKEESMMDSKEIKLLAELENIQKNLIDTSKKKVTRVYEKVLMRIGRIKEKYAYAAKKYDICVVADDKKEKALDLKWTIIKRNEEKAKENIGTYLLRTNDLMLSELEIWDTYNLLTRVEGSFRCIKSDTGLRPIYHQLEERADAHMFISVLAYHIINTIEYKLRQKGDTRTWSTLRGVLSTHVAISVNLNVIENDTKVAKNIRMGSNPEVKHTQIYDALEIKHQPVKRKITNISL